MNKSNTLSHIRLAMNALLLVSVTLASGCRDYIEAPDAPELEESETVRFVVQNYSDGWTASRSADNGNTVVAWEDLFRLDSVTLPYPNLFIQAGKTYLPQVATMSPYDPDDPLYVSDKGVVRREELKSSIALDVQSNSDRYGRLQVNTIPMTDKALSELRSLAAASRPGSRTTIVDETNVADFYSNVGVSAICYDGVLGFGYTDDLVKTMDDELVKMSGDRWLTTEGNYYWNVWGQDYNRVRFFAYAPYGTPGLTQTDDAEDGTPRFDYDVDPDVDRQIDLGAIAVTTPGNFRRTVPLRFDHILTGVRFLVDDSHMASCLKRVTLGGVYGSGTYKYSTAPYDFTDPDDTSNPNINPDVRPDKPGVTPGDQKIEKGTWSVRKQPDAEYNLKEDDFFGDEKEPIRSEFSHEGGDDYWCVTEQDRMFMLMPQQLPESAYIEAEFYDEGETIIMRGKIGGKDDDGNQREWVQGTIVTYVITTYDIEYVLKLVKEGGAYPYSGGFDNHTVISYAMYYDKAGNIRKIVPVEWTPVFYDENNNEVPAPDWATVTYDRTPGRKKDYRPADFNKSVEEFVEYFQKNLEDSVCCGHVTVDPQYALRDDSHSEALRKAPAVGTAENPVNLSGYWAGRRYETYSTANSYIINAPGYYNIPLVYGNGIKNGATNSQAWNGMANNNGNYPFMTHIENRRITDPWLRNTAAIADAAIVTTNVKHAVQLVHVDQEFLTVYVDSTYIGQGNTIVAVRDASGDIMWSWHLWTTDYDPYGVSGSSNSGTSAVPNDIGETYSFMKANLGWVYPQSASSDPRRTTYWRPLQKRGNAFIQDTQTKEEAGYFVTKNRYRASQDEYIATNSGHAPYYNWGRKDALMRTIHMPAPLVSEDHIVIANKYSYRWLFDNKNLSSSGRSKRESLRAGHWYYQQFTMAEATRLPWAMGTIYRMQPMFDSSGNMTNTEEGSTVVDHNVTWWTGKYDKMTNVGPVPLKTENKMNPGAWPTGAPNSNGINAKRLDYDFYTDLWCIGQTQSDDYLAESGGSAAHQVVKSVYDPCPPDFMVPPNRAFDRLCVPRGKAMLDEYKYLFEVYDLELPAMPFLTARKGSGALNYNISAPQWDMDEGRDADGYLPYCYCFPMEEVLFGNTCSLWTADVVNAAGIVSSISDMSSFYNITLDFVTNPGEHIGANGATSQINKGQSRAATGRDWSMSTRQVRPVREQ